MQEMMVDLRLATGLVSSSFPKSLMAANVFSKSKPLTLLRMEKKMVGVGGPGERKC